MLEPIAWKFPAETDDDISDPDELGRRVDQLETEMREAARKFEFERAAALRDRARELRTRQLELS